MGKDWGGLGYSSAVECLHSIHKALGSIPAPTVWESRIFLVLLRHSWQKAIELVGLCQNTVSSSSVMCISDSIGVCVQKHVCVHVHVCGWQSIGCVCTCMCMSGRRSRGVHRSSCTFAGINSCVLHIWDGSLVCFCISWASWLTWPQRFSSPKLTLGTMWLQICVTGPDFFM